MHGSQEMYLTEGFGIIDDEHLNSLQIKEQKLHEMRERKNKSKKRRCIRQAFPRKPHECRPGLMLIRRLINYQPNVLRSGMGRAGD